MKRRIPPLAVFLFGAACSTGDTLPGSSPGLSDTEVAYSTVSFPSGDGLEITADLYEGVGPTAPTLLLFHQSASGSGELRDVGPRLARLGYNALAVDLRWGGTWQGVRDETAPGNSSDTVMAAGEPGTGSPRPGIEAAYGDMRAARRWLENQGFSGSVFALGSSPSAAHAFRLALGEEVAGTIAYEDWATLATFLGHHTGGPPARTQARVEGTDGVTVFADVYGEGTARGWIVLLHQGGGSARGEYGFLVPRLLEMGYGVVTPDLHGGGDRFGSPNRTLAATPEDQDFGYCDAAPQLQAVLDWTRTQADGLPVVVWGSSYSAALAVHVGAADPPDATLAFSPASGEPMDGCRPEAVAETFSGPLLIVRPEGEAEIPSVVEQLRRFAAAGHETWVSTPGAHGSSTLNPLRVPDLPATAWLRVRAFLERHTAR